MAVVKMKKIMLAVPKSQRGDILNHLQSEGSVQLIDLKESVQEEEDSVLKPESKSLTQIETDYNEIKFTYEFLKRFSGDKKGLLAKKEVIDKEKFDSLEDELNWKDIYNRCKDIDEAINSIKNKKSRISSAIELYSDWINLDVNSGHLGSLNRVSYFIGTVPKKNEPQLSEELTQKSDGIYIGKVSEKKQDINLFILFYENDKAAVADVLKTYGFNRVNLELAMTPGEQVKEYEDEAEKLDSDLESMEAKAVELGKSVKDIEKVFDFITNKLEKENAQAKFAQTARTSILQGWIPEKDTDKLRKSIEEKYRDAYVGFEDPGDDDVPPVMLKNNKFSEPFEVITSMYALPQYSEVDPTPVLTPFYLVFFGMMAGDIGYGLILFLVTMFALKYMDIEGDARKLVKLLFYCSIPTIIFGWVFGGFFGNAIPIKPLWVNPVDKPMDVLYVSVALGIVHLFTGLGVKAYWFIKTGKTLDAIFDVFFWYMLLTGLIWLLIGGGDIPKYMAIAGALGLLLTQGRSNATLVGKFFGGLYGLYGVTSYIGDVLSYSRLLALGLATGLIGSSFNLLIQLLGGGVAAIIAGPIVFIAGHTFNILIGMLGTFVHTCRLEYLEFFGKFYEGGGKAFDPLRIKTKYIKVNTQK